MYGLMSLAAQIAAFLAGLWLTVTCAIFLSVIQEWGLLGIAATVLAWPAVVLGVPLWALIGYGYLAPILALTLAIVFAVVLNWARSKDFRSPGAGTLANR